VININSRITAFLKRISRPIISELTPSDVSEFLSSDEIVFIASFPPDTDANENEPSSRALYEYQFRDLAAEYHDRYSFGIVFSSSETKSNPKSKPSEEQVQIKCHNNLLDSSFSLPELSLQNLASLPQLLDQCTAPLILEPSRAEIARLGDLAAERAVVLVVHFFASLESQRDEYVEKVAIPLAKRYKDDVLFTVIDSVENPTMPALVGLGEGGTGVVVENLKTGEVFRFEEKKIEEGRLERFLGDVVRGGVKAWGHDEL